MSNCQKVFRPLHVLLRQAATSPAGCRPFSTASRLHDAQSESNTIDAKTETVNPTTSTSKPDPAVAQSNQKTASITNESSSTPTDVTDSTAKTTTRTIDPLTVSNPRRERALIRQGKLPIGSRRRRAAIKTSSNIPFQQLPYQCFQDALNVLAEDRKEKLVAIRETRNKISKLEAKDGASIQGGEIMKARKLRGLRTYLETLKIQADINDPLIKKKFEDGMGTYCSPVEWV